MVNSYYGESSSTAVTKSRVDLGAGRLEDFKVTVTDISGRVWTGTESNRPSVKPRPPSPEWLEKELSGFESKRVLDACTRAMAFHQVEVGTLESDWEGSSCADKRLRLSEASLDTVSKTLITLLPGTVEGYRITVWSRTGKQLSHPERPTSFPPPTVERPEPGELLNELLWTLLLAALLHFATFKLWSSRLIGAAGWLVAGVAGLGVVVFGNAGGEVGGYIALGILLALGNSLIFIVPRLAVWWGREAWWVSLGTGLLSLAITGALISALETGTNLGLSLPTVGRGFSALSLLPCSRWPSPSGQPGNASERSALYRFPELSPLSRATLPP